MCGGGGVSIGAGIMSNLHYDGVDSKSDNIKVAFLCSRFGCKQNQEVPKNQEVLLFKDWSPSLKVKLLNWTN